MNDVSAIAFQVSEYDSYGYNGWVTVGGTSVSSPLVGGVFGLAGNASKQDAGKKFWSLKKKAGRKISTTSPPAATARAAAATSAPRDPATMARPVGNS